MNLLKQCLKIFIGINIVVSVVFPQDSWEVFTKKDGLVDEGVMQILEDSSGNLWFRTVNKGVMKYNGTNWINYSTNNGLLSNKIVTMHKHSDGTILFGDFKGIVRYNGKSFDIIENKYGTDHIIEDSSGNLWFGPMNAYCYYDGENVNRITKKGGNIPSTFLTSHYYDKKNNTMWFGGRSNGISSYDGKNWIVHSEEVGAPTTQITTIVSDDDGVVWVGTNKGVYSYNGIEWSHYSIENGLVTDDILQLHKDNNNRIWAISGKTPTLLGLGFAIDLISAGASALSKSGLHVYSDGKWHAFADDPGVPTSRVTKLFETSNGDLWFDTYIAGIHRYDGSSWFEYNDKNGVSNHFWTEFEDSKGNVWFGLSNLLGKGLGKFDGKDWTIYNTDTGLPGNGIVSIFEDSKGNMWFSTDKSIIKYMP